MLAVSSTLLLIGAGGLVGRHLRSALTGRDVVSTYRRALQDDGVELDITDADAVRGIMRAHRPAVVLLAAAEAWVERCEREPEATRRVNVEASRVIAAEAERIGSLLVVFSSEYVFDGSRGLYYEDDVRRPLNEYGRQKVALEDIALATGRALVCRTSGVFGDEPRRKNFVAQVVDHLRAGRQFEVPDDQLITPTYAPSLASAVVSLIDAQTTGIVHTAGPRVLNRLAFGGMVAAAFGLPSALLVGRRTSELRLSATRPLRCGLGVDRLNATLEHPLTDPGEALRELAAQATT